MQQESIMVEIMSGRPDTNLRFNEETFKTLLVMALLAICFGSMTTNAQILYGSITGPVSSTTGAMILGVAVILTILGTGAVRSTTANSPVTYLILAVLPGAYSDYFLDNRSEPYV